MSDDMVFPALMGAFITCVPTLLFFANGMFVEKRNYSTLCCIMETDRGYAAAITAGATAALYLLTTGLVAQYSQTVALLRAICDNPRRIIGFSRIDTPSTHSADMIRIRSDFALDTMEHQTNRLCVCTAGTPHIHGKNV